MKRGPSQTRLFMRKIVPFAFGIFIGFSFAVIWTICEYRTRESEHSSKWLQLVRGYTRNDDNQILEDFTVATSLYNEVKVLCFVMTYTENHQKKAIHVKNTWGSRCNKLIFMSSETDEVLGAVALNISNGREHLWNKTKQSLQYVYDNHMNDYDWFLKADDDTYVIVENLRYFLYSHKPESPIYFGYKFKPHVTQGYMSGGAGYVLSREAVRRFIEVALPNNEACKPNGAEDVYLGLCLESANVTAGDSRDELGRGRFFPLTPVKHLVPKKESEPWYWEYMFYKTEDGLNGCSNNAISFHYVPADDMYVLDYLIYSLQPYGMIKYPQALHKG